MFARFRQVRDRLNVSIVEAARDGAKVRQSHIANLGSVPVPPSITDKSRFWFKLHHRVATLGNRMDDETRLAILTAINARIPIPTVEEQETDQEAARRAGREANSGLFASLREKHRSLADAYRRAAEQKTAATEAVDGLEAAHASRPMTRAEMRRFLKSIGMTDADLRQSRDLNAICERWGEDRVITALVREYTEAGEKARHRATRRLHRLAVALDESRGSTT